MLEEYASINSRFRGPPDSGNGGYTCGILGALIDGCAEVTLKAPPPLETELRISEGAGEWKLEAGDRLIATGRPSALDLEIPSPPSYEEAEAAESRYAGWHDHIFPECFVCGPDRAAHDGLRVFAGQLDDRDVVASHWHPGQDVAGEFGAVSARVVWAALDCPTYFANQIDGPKGPAVLGRLTADLIAPVLVGEPHVVIAWPEGSDERKFHGGSAIYTAEGELLAVGRGTWVKIAADHGQFNVRA